MVNAPTLRRPAALHALLLVCVIVLAGCTSWAPPAFSPGMLPPEGEGCQFMIMPSVSASDASAPNSLEAVVSDTQTAQLLPHRWSPPA